MLLGRVFFAKSLRSKSAKTYRLLAVFFVSRNSHEKKGACSRACYLFISPVCGSDSFCTKNPHILRQDCVRWHNNANNIWFFAHSTQKLQKPYVFCIFMPPDAILPKCMGIFRAKWIRPAYWRDEKIACSTACSFFSWLFLETKKTAKNLYIFAIFERSDFAKKSGPKTPKKWSSIKKVFQKWRFYFLFYSSTGGGWPHFFLF